MMHVKILHNGGAGRFTRYQPGDALTLVFELDIHAHFSVIAAEIVYAIANSYTEELHGQAVDYPDEVAGYRAAQLRSLSTGDVVVVVDPLGYEAALACATVGFERLPAVPDFLDWARLDPYSLGFEELAELSWVDAPVTRDQAGDNARIAAGRARDFPAFSDPANRSKAFKVESYLERYAAAREGR